MSRLPSRSAYLVPHLVGLALVLCALLIAVLMPRTGGGGWVRTVADGASNQGNATFISVGVMTLLGLAYAARSKADFWRVFWVVAGTTIAVQIVQKTTFHVFHILARPSGRDGGFPSGHAAVACALAYCLSERLPRLSVLWYAIAALITWSRVEAGAHYPYQVVCGAIFGIVCAIVYFQAVEPRQSKPVPPAVETYQNRQR